MRRLAFLAVVVLACACQPVTQTDNPRPVYGVLIADPSHLESDYAAGVRLAIRSEHWNTWSPATATAERAVLDRYRAAGFTVGVNMGLHTPPASVLAEPDGALVDQHGNRSKQANLVWNQSVRDRAANYMRSVLDQLGPIDAVTVGVGSTGEADYPDPVGDGWWAFGSSAQAVSPAPGWVPGQPAPVDQVAGWWAWYRDSLVSTVRWEIGTLRDAGFEGTIQIQIPGAGAKPTTSGPSLSGVLAGATGAVRSAAVFDQTIPAIAAGESNVAFVATSLGNQTGVPVGNVCEPDDVERVPTDPAIDSWSSARWVAYLVHRAGLRLVAENTGWNEAVDLPTIAAQMDSCGIRQLSWAFNYQLYDHVHASIGDLAEMIAR